MTLPAGQVQTVFGVQIREDNELEPAELFTASLKVPRLQTGVALGLEQNAVVTVIDRNGEEFVRVHNFHSFVRSKF